MSTVDIPAEDPVDLEDLAAELDHEPGPETGGEPGDEPGEGDCKALWAGEVVGGPYDGRWLISRFGDGVLLVDKESGRAWLHDRDRERGCWVCRRPEGEPLWAEGRWRAAESDTWEVRAFDPDFAGDDAAGAREVVL